MPRPLPPKPSLTHLRKEAKRLVTAHQRGDAAVCPALRLHHRFKKAADAAILEAHVSLQEVQHALAMDYGFKDWAELKAFVESSSRLSMGERFDWIAVIGKDRPNCRVEGTELVVENPAGKGPGLHVELGGMSWDNYRLGVDVLVERESSSGVEFSDAHFPAGVQLCPRGTCVYCQLFRGVVNLAYWDNDRKEHFTHLVNVHLPAPLPTGAWHRFEIEVRSPHVAAVLNGKQVAEADMPFGTAGMPGLVVNYNSDAKVRLRNLRIRFLEPTRQQVEEFGTDPKTNWENYKRRQVEAGLRKSMDDNSL